MKNLLFIPIHVIYYVAFILSFLFLCLVVPFVGMYAVATEVADWSAEKLNKPGLWKLRF